jgi:hypothetical protein
LKEPSTLQRKIIEELAKYSDKLVAMSFKGEEFLKEIYNIPKEKIVVIPHGIPDTPFLDPNYYKDQFGVEGKKVILTFGLLSPRKGIEYVIKALPEILKKHPETVYIVLGATHPHIKQMGGEEYRVELQRLAKELKVDDQVIFHNRFVEIEDLCQFLGAADLYITPYLDEVQIVSGTLSYAMGTGNATISTPYWHAVEMLAEGRGRIVPFADHKAIAKEVIDLFDNDVERQAIRKRAYMYTRNAVWKEVARQYLEVFIEVKERSALYPQPRARSKEVKIGVGELPAINLDHLINLTDDTGILQHSNFTIPNRFHGYCTDDNARALIVVMKAQHMLPEEKQLNRLASTYLSFLEYAFNEEEERFRNFLSFNRNWLEDKGSEDSHARAVWGLGVAVSMAKYDGQIAMAMNLFKKSLKALRNFTTPRSLSFGLVGIHAYLSKFGGDTETRQVREVLANRLFKLFKDNASDEWPWLEDTLTYANGKLPHALLLSGQWMQKGEMVEMGLKALEWLMNLQIIDNHFVPIGNRGWYSKGKKRARFDQQPIEALSMIEACIEAYNVTRKEKWLEATKICFNWFVGENDLNTSLYDFSTGGCRDGLEPEGPNHNQGAESTLAWLLSLLSIYFLKASQS